MKIGFGDSFRDDCHSSSVETSFDKLLNTCFSASFGLVSNKARNCLKETFSLGQRDRNTANEHIDIPSNFKSPNWFVMQRNLRSSYLQQFHLKSRRRKYLKLSHQWWVARCQVTWGMTSFRCHGNSDPSCFSRTPVTFDFLFNVDNIGLIVFKSWILSLKIRSTHLCRPSPLGHPAFTDNPREYYWQKIHIISRLKY